MARSSPETLPLLLPTPAESCHFLLGRVFRFRPGLLAAGALTTPSYWIAVRLPHKTASCRGEGNGHDITGGRVVGCYTKQQGIAETRFVRHASPACILGN